MSYRTRYEKTHYTKIRIRKETYQELKWLSQQSGLTMLDILDRAVGLVKLHFVNDGFIPDPEQVRKEVEEYGPRLSRPSWP